MFSKSIKTVSSFICIVLFLTSHLLAQDTIQYITPGRENAAVQQQKPYVILISADSFRYDLAEKYNAEFLKKISTKGVKAVSMRPSYPSLTFPNHYSIATGLYPSHHGIIANTFYDKKRNQFYTIRNKKAVQDSSWYGGVPLWVLAERQKMLSASFYWVGSESHIDGVDPTYYFNYNEAIPIDRRLEILKQWLELPPGKRPHFITFYFPEVDHAAHRYGTNSSQTHDAVQLIDHSIQKMNEMCAQLNLPINFIFVSDHGMANVDTLHPIRRPTVIDTSKFVIANGGALTQLYAKNKKDIKPTYRKLKKVAKDYDVYLKKRIPKRWHYSKKDDSLNRIGDIILVAHPPKVFGFSNRPVSAGQHGFDNYLPEMQATFYAWGPAFKENYEIGSFTNINIYPLIAHILGLNIDSKIDGDLKVLEGILK
ncbi:ectonucleotide pyrophosphatase/phosphodiesterase [Aequorivita capsosiphonis]|uniref:alkaline phosphatase family protein n=1 Tax=Aequorivita capsosiphonis TaxID=487317 RepID=UPI00041DB361|nr:ectonucleotide pyrophosphatase/phosphodiesterase [Aequorivita capsosiphonis]